MKDLFADWDSIRSFPQTAYDKAHEFCCACAGEGQEVTAQELGFRENAFTFPNAYILRIEESAYEVIYSMDHDTSELGVDFMRYNPII